MLVNCPKCGFSQPQDRYCASCGVDIINFKPRENPLWKEILGNPFVHVGFIFVLVFISILFIRKQQRDDLRARVEYLKGGPVLVERQHERSLKDEKTHPSATTENNAASLNDQASDQESAASATAMGSTATATSAGDPPAANRLAGKGLRTFDTAAKPSSMKMIVTYAELDRVTLDAWHEEMRAAGQFREFGAVSMGTLNQASAKMKAARNFKVLQKINRTIESGSPSLEWFIGTHHGNDPENEMGLFSSLNMNDNKEGLIRGELEIQRAFRDPKDVTKTMERVSFGGPFELAPGAAYLMSGLIPRKFAIELEDEMAPDAFLSIFKSRAFVNRETEFTLILEFDTAAK